VRGLYSACRLILGDASGRESTLARRMPGEYLAGVVMEEELEYLVLLVE
jgi:hypothetical protein